ncbi:cardioacceleratory peptide receptor [Plakobranchus ocellatus]|uniref:Cardioacceleratory peptide receptor n=1 Tax=Plakobranchus ocellatus TaxID=259542 RepID=A0AAV3Z4Y2_9GAST|nr:cardioacceleratory peptide receptor [Plakobranchus ocellatus]
MRSKKRIFKQSVGKVVIYRKDLLTGPLIVLVDIITKVTEYWYAGDAVCKMLKFSQITVMYSSTYMLVALSIDRLDAVARPLHFTGSWLRAKVLVATAWILSGVFAVPQLVLFKAMNNQCQIYLDTMLQWKVYVTLVALSIFFIPACIILVCYLAIIVVIFNSSDLSSTISRGNKAKESDTLRCSEGERGARNRSVSCQSSRGVIPQAKIRTIKMTFMIVLVFIVCWSPYFVFNLCSVFGAVPPSAAMQKISIFIQSLCPLNSAANPLIYGVFSTRICRFLRRAPLVQKMSGTALKSCCVSSSTSGPSTSNKFSTGDYTSMSDTDDFRLTGDCNGITRIPLVKQELTQEDRDLLSKHLKVDTIACDSV